MGQCFAESGAHCSILFKKQCEDCKFYKTQQEFLAGRLKSLDRIKRMPPERFNSITNTYYGGKYNQEYETLIKTIAEDEQERAGQA